MKRILCYGDSNTWGFEPVSTQRYPESARWTGILGKLLGAGYRVIEEGLNGRTTVVNDPFGDGKNGREYLLPCLESHRPLDLVIVMLGTNDLKARFSLTAFDIADGAGILVRMIQAGNAGPGGKPPRVLLVAPPPVAKLSAYAEMFEGALPKSQKFAEYYTQVAKACDCGFLNAGSVVTSSNLDGIHLELSEHQKLGQALSEKVKKILG